MDHKPDEREQAVALLSSTIEKCENMQRKFAEGTAHYTTAELKEALPPVMSIIHKTTKAQRKHEQGSPKYKQYEPLIRTMEISKAVIEGRIME